MDFKTFEDTQIQNEKEEKALLRRIKMKMDNGSDSRAEVEKFFDLLKADSDLSEEYYGKGHGFSIENEMNKVAEAMSCLSEKEMESGFITTEHEEEIAEKVFGDKNVHWFLSKEEREQIDKEINDYILE